jgi:hypothetical protein
MLEVWDAQLTERLRPAAYNFIFKFPELTFHVFFARTTPKHLYLG